MKSIKFLSIFILVLLGGFWLFVNFVVTYVPLGFVGIRTQEYGILGKKGIVQKDFYPGWHRNFGPIDSWVLFDSTVQTLEMAKSSERSDAKGIDSVAIQSADGYSISVDVTIKYKIKDNLAHKLYQNTGSGVKYKTIVRNEARSACIDVFGTMKTEDFYNPNERRHKSKLAKEKLIKNLDDNFIDAIDILIRDVTFDPEYENKIRRKKLADQEVELNKSMGNAASMSGKTQIIEAESAKLVQIITKEKEAELIKMQANTSREITKIIAEYEKYSTEKKADADLIVSQKEAEGKLLLKKAEAEGERLRNEAMQGVGGGTIVALEAAKNLNLKNVTVSSMNIDFLDLDKMVTKLGVSE